MNLPLALLRHASLRLSLSLLLLGVLCLWLGVQTRPAHAILYLTVTDCSGENGPNQIGSVIQGASSGDKIFFQCAGDIKLSSPLTINTTNLTIDGNGNNVTLDGQNSVVVFYVNRGVSLNLTHLTIANGTATATDGGCGGGIYSAGTLNVSLSTFANNSAISNPAFGSAWGGAICSEADSTLSIDSSTFTGNSTDGGGAAILSGGIYAKSGTLTISNSTFTNNSTSNTVGSLCSEGSGGGAILFGGTGTISNSTFTNNSVSAIGGGAIRECGSSSTLSISNSTIVGNSAPSGDGGLSIDSGTVNVQGSIVANNTGGDCTSGITDNGYNLDSDSSCFTASTSKHGDPLLSALANNGGPTQTMALQQSSPAIDAVPLSANICTTSDQRSDQRPDPDSSSETACDMGAYESSYDKDLGLTNLPANITTNATSSSGATVTYTSPTVLDEDYPLPLVSCNPPSGTLFAIGTTTVTCTVTDIDDSNSPVSQSFTVTVRPVLTLSVPATIKATEGAAPNRVWATGKAYGISGPLKATINWGDGSTASVLSVTVGSDDGYSITTSHSYAEEGNCTLSVTVTDSQGMHSLTRSSTVAAADATLKITKLSQSSSGLTLTSTSVFSDHDPNGTLADYSTSINWGDGTITSATVGTSSTGFTTQGNHSYASHGTYTVTLTINDVGGSTVSKSVTITV